VVLGLVTEFANFVAAVAPAQNSVTAFHCSAVHLKIGSEITAAGDQRLSDTSVQLASEQMRLAMASEVSEEP
jgi:hypothetical protein